MGSEVTVHTTPPPPPPRITGDCSQKEVETIALTHQVCFSMPSSVVGSLFWFPRLLRARPGSLRPLFLGLFSEPSAQKA